MPCRAEKSATAREAIETESSILLRWKADGQEIHSFIHSGYLYSASSSPLLLRSASDTAHVLSRSFTPKRHRKLRVKELPKVPTWRLERDSNPRPFGRKASNIPMRHHVITHKHEDLKRNALLHD